MCRKTILITSAALLYRVHKAQHSPCNLSPTGSSRQEATASYGSDTTTICRHLCPALITQPDSECMLGRGDVPGDILGTLVPSASANSVLQLEGFDTQLSL